MAVERALTPAEQVDALQALQREKIDRLRELVSRTRGDKPYRRVLRAYLDADGELRKALLEHSRPGFDNLRTGRK